MNNYEFEQLIRQTEACDLQQISDQVTSVLAKHGGQIGEGQRVDLLYLEYLIRRAGGDDGIIDDLCQRYPRSAKKLIRQVEVDTELSRLDSETELPRSDHESTSAAINQIGQYKVVEKIGEGAQAEVFRVIHPMLRCELAMKVGKHASGTGDRVLDEGRMLVKFNEPGIARVIDAGFWQDRSFIVSELVRGITFKQRIDDGSLDQKQAIEALVGLARTVSALHDAGIVHCDIKPTNVLVDQAGRSKLVDFGLAIDRSFDVWDDSASSREDHASGTLVYMAPELFDSSEQSTSVNVRQTACDVFSLGVLLFYTLVGKHPYASAPSTEILGRVASGQWDRRVLHECNVPADLVRICESAMSSDPKQRMSSANEFAHQLQRFVDRSLAQLLSTKLSVAFAVATVVVVGCLVWPPRDALHSSFRSVDGLGVEESLRAERFGHLDIKVWSEDRAFDLVHRVPIETGDGLQINAPLRAGCVGELWSISSDGSVESIANFGPEGAPRWVHYPAELDQAAPMAGPSGAETIVWLESKPSASLSGEQIAEILRLPGDWPAMSNAMVFRLVDGALRIEHDDRSLGPATAIETPSAVIQKHLRRAAADLAQKGIESEIIAFPHVE